MQNSSPRSAGDATRLAVFRDMSTRTWVVDVTVWGHPVDRSHLANLGDPVLICFGGHDSPVCALGVGQHDGVAIEIAEASAGHANFAARFRSQIDPEVPLTVTRRRSAVREATATSPTFGDRMRALLVEPRPEEA